MQLDIHAGVVMVTILAVVGALASIWFGIRRIRKGRKIHYYRLSRRQVAGGFWIILLAPLLLGFAFLVARLAEPLAYTYFPPSPTVSSTPTISLTSTISLTPTISQIPSITFTPAISDTPTPAATPFMPEVIAVQFVSTVTPNPAAVFSPLSFSRTIANYQAVDPGTVFENPITRLFATFSYDGMTDGVQWTAIWYRDGQLVYYETESWQGGTGGYAYSTWMPLAEESLPGTYQVVLFVGLEWKVLGEFRIIGDPPTPTITPSPTVTRTSTPTLRPTITPRPSDTRWPSPTPTIK